MQRDRSRRNNWKEVLHQSPPRSYPGSWEKSIICHELPLWRSQNDRRWRYYQWSVRWAGWWMNADERECVKRLIQGEHLHFLNGSICLGCLMTLWITISATVKHVELSGLAILQAARCVEVRGQSHGTACYPCDTRLLLYMLGYRRRTQ